MFRAVGVVLSFVTEVRGGIFLVSGPRSQKERARSHTPPFF